MSDRRRALGQKGEQIAEAFLEQKGYRILERNVRTRRGEIDLIAVEGQSLVFVEVRTRTGTSFGTAAESVTIRKQKKLRELAMAYLQTIPEYVPSFRFDVIAIQCPSRGEPTQDANICHIEHAF
jgi:putative endonuclease